MRKKVFTVYGTAALTLVILIVAAFLGPEIAFNVQDGIRCQEVVSVTRENLDITSFNTGYETDLCRRLTRFAEGLAEGEQYYVTVQEMDPGTQVRTMSDFDKIIHSDSFELYAGWDPWNLRFWLDNVFYGAEVNCWKQCVIYGDDFAGGVNFILWYLEVNSGGNPVFRLLADGETGELYGFRTDTIVFYLPDDDLEMQLKEHYYAMLDRFDYPENIWEVCVALGVQFGGLDITDRLYWLDANGYRCAFVETEEGAEMMRVLHPNTEVRTEGEESAEGDEYRLEEIEDFLDTLRWQTDEENKSLNFTYPFGKGELNLRIQLSGSTVDTDEGPILYMNRIFGFPEIYELIPEFMEK